MMSSAGRINTGSLMPTLLLLWSTAVCAQGPRPMLSVNDHVGERPLFTALTQQAAGLEVDLFLHQDELLLGPYPDSLTRGRSLTNLYLEPLRLLIARNQGQLYPDSTRSLWLILDIKSDAEASYTALLRALQPYQNILTHYRQSGSSSGPVSVIIAGNFPQDIAEREDERLFALQGHQSTLEGPALNPALTPLVVLHWATLTDWVGEGPAPPGWSDSLVALMAIGRQAGVALRLDGVPERPAVWQQLLDMDIELIGATRIEYLGMYFNSNGR